MNTENKTTFLFGDPVIMKCISLTKITMGNISDIYISEKIKFSFMENKLFKNCIIIFICEDTYVWRIS